ncbi:MAG: pyridoxal-phosphate dependent enzyme [Acidimicrobiales bacterium]
MNRSDPSSTNPDATGPANLASAIPAAAIELAATRIEGQAIRTPLIISEPLSERTGATIVIKAEHRQRTGSFKIRGALNKTFSLTDDLAASGVITASSGNHGIGVATAAASRKIPCTVYLPSGAAPPKVAAIKRLGATVVTVDDTDTALAESEARVASADRGIRYISPYNDPDIVAGQGTIGLEILADAAGIGLGSVDAVIAAVGGGGLISGIASWVKQHSPDTVVVGASPENDQAMAASVAAGRIFEPPATATYSDGTAGAVEADAITFPICSNLVDRWIAISEIDIARAVSDMINDHHELIEGAAGVALAAAHRYGVEHPGANIVVVSCGANISPAALRRMLNEDL